MTRSACSLFVIAVSTLTLTACTTPTQADVDVRMHPVINGGPVRWLQIPTDADMLDVYPRDALNAGANGHVRMICVMTAAGTLTDCGAASETPPGQGFGAAAVRLGHLFRFDAADRPDLVGKRGAVNVTFRTGG
jgi:TonB family protein